MAPRIDLTGRRFGQWFVVRDEERGRGREVLVRCDCGTERRVLASSLRRGETLCCRRGSCATTYKHGGIDTPEYKAWLHMRERCTNPRAEKYPSYGGRGIRFCAAWNDFPAFRDDVGPRPSPAHSIDRIDNNGHYSCGKCDECKRNVWPANCRWATRVEQQNNRRNTVRVGYFGELLTLRELSARTGVPRETLRDRHRAGLRGPSLFAPRRPSSDFAA